MTRLGFSQTEMDARTYVIGLMKEAGLVVRIDAAGNIYTAEAQLRGITKYSKD